MDFLRNLISQNVILSIAAASVLLVLAGLLLKKFKLIAFILVILAGIILYFFIGTDKAGKVQIDEIRQKVKEKVVENL